MANVFHIAYSELVFREVIAGSRKFISRCHQLEEIPDGAQVGAISVVLLDAVTPVDLVEGTVVVNAHGQQKIDLELVDKAAPLSMKPTAWKSSLATPGAVNKMIKGSVNAMIGGAMNQAIADLKAATPGKNATLATGGIDFLYQSVASSTADLQKVAGVLAQCWAGHADLDPDDFALIMTPIAYGNFAMLVASTLQFKITREDGLNRFLGVPIFPFSGTNAFGGASENAAYIINRRNYALAFKDVTINGPPNQGGFIYAGDGYMKLIPTGVYAHKVLDVTYMGEIINPAS